MVNILYQKFGFQLFPYSPGTYSTVKYIITGNVVRFFHTRKLHVALFFHYK